MLEGAIVVPVMQLVYSVLFEVGAVVWGLQRAFLLTGYVVMSMTDWLVSQAFTPLLTALGAQTEIFLVPTFTIALLVLALSYLIAMFLRVRVVEFKSALIWFLLALLLFQGGAQLYGGIEEARRDIADTFYQQGLAIMSDGGGALAVLSDIGNGAEAPIPVPTNQFASFLASDQDIDGLDVAMSYIGADSYDVVAPASAPHPIERLPWLYLNEGGYFDPATGSIAFASMSQVEREAAIGRGVQGISRLVMGSLVSIFGVLEQVIHLALAIAMGLAFASAFIAILFAFFKHTEVLVWSVLKLVIELFVQSIIISLFLSLIISFVLVGAVTGNAVVTFGTALVGLLLVIILLLASFRAIWNGINRLFGAMSQVTGGTISSPGSVAAGAVGMAAGGAMGAAGTALALSSGNSLAQSAGIALGGNSTLTRAAYMTSLMPNMRGTRFGDMASEFAEGAIARTALGPVVAGAILPKRGIEESSTTAPQSRATERTEAPRTQPQPDDIVRSYYQTPDRSTAQAGLQSTFGPVMAPEMARLLDAHTEDDMSEVATAIRNLRAEQPQLQPTSDAFVNTLKTQVAGSTSVPMSTATLRTMAEGFHKAEQRASGQYVLQAPELAQALASAVAGLSQAGMMQPLSHQQATAAVAQSAGVMASPNAHPFGMHTAAVGHFVKQAVGLQTSPPQIAQVLTQTREQGGISEGLRAALRSNPGNETRSSGEMDRAVRALEAAARALPQAMTIGNQQPFMQPIQPSVQPQPGAVDIATHHYDLPDDEVLP
ncbi:hypothetical protein G4Y79_14500 [Phototrophicus methaneseepsis]|uniref:Uncharacterized protein n=1 Tax=Phototrophicus methaneseepsis TaxID=2710758 RepID=A0A7S8E5V0_9CHLR|nr:hypothetical protein [Phototrophicus methaneseepsis]QPC80916.1 hypothetical protein G4Y79_14500 [Phototrophicus methaneseepsis]